MMGIQIHNMMNIQIQINYEYPDSAKLWVSGFSKMMSICGFSNMMGIWIQQNDGYPD